MKRLSPILIFCVLLVGSCHRKTVSSGVNVNETGMASFYSERYNGKKTANGEIYNSSKYTAAHKTLPFGTKVKVTNLSNQKTVKVIINDRGPFIAGRVIDLTLAAAKKIEMVNAGIVKVKISN